MDFPKGLIFMAQRQPFPFNIDLFIPTTADSFYPKVTSLDTYISNSKNFHPEGLYSTEIFGIVGTPDRDSKFGYIDIKIPILHPIIYKAYAEMRVLYRDIMSSREFAVWDNTIKDFVKSNPVDGETGYEFFIQHFKELNIEDTNSTKREQTIRLLDKYKNNCLIDKVFVIPAGYRDLEVDRNGRESSDEVNNLYYKILAISNTINANVLKISPEAYNTQRMAIQRGFVEIYDYYYNIISGKKNLMLGKWANRKIFNSTRNVITSVNSVSVDLDNPDNLTMNDTCVGLFQTAKAIMPITINKLRNGFISECFTAMGIPALLTNKKTLRSERVSLQNNEYEYWLTNEGIEKLINNFREESIRHKEVTVGDYYLGLIYKGNDNTFKMIHGIDELPEGFSKECCYPITYAELIYIAIYDVANNYPAIVSRYPITGVGSIYPSKTYLKTTAEYETRAELGNDWKMIGDDKVAKQFPITGSSFYNSMSPSAERLSGLGADKNV